MHLRVWRWSQAGSMIRNSCCRPPIRSVKECSSRWCVARVVDKNIILWGGETPGSLSLGHLQDTPWSPPENSLLHFSSPSLLQKNSKPPSELALSEADHIPNCEEMVPTYQGADVMNRFHFSIDKWQKSYHAHGKDKVDQHLFPLEQWP
jgi:hypothetical protein